MEEFDYKRYLSSDNWKGKAKLVMRRARGVCEGCLSRSATQIHHLTYDHCGDELLFELVALCRDCHMRIHGFRHGQADGEISIDESSEEKLVRSEWLFHLHGQIPLNAESNNYSETPLIGQSGPKWPDLRPIYEVQAKTIIRTLDWLREVAKKRGFSTIHHITSTVIREEVKAEQDATKVNTQNFHQQSDITPSG